MARTVCVLVVIFCASTNAQLYQRTNYDRNSNSNYNYNYPVSRTNYDPVSRTNYDPGSLDYGHIYDRSSSSQTYVAPPSRSSPVERDDSNQRLQLAYDAYLRELRAASALSQSRRDPLPPPHDLQPAAQHNNAAASAQLERSDSYGYGDDCSDLDTLSLALGLGALAAFAAYYFTQQQAAARSSSWAPMMEALQSRLPEPMVLEAMTEGACRGLDALKSRSSRRKKKQAAQGTGRGIGGDCLEGLIGPAAGFFALAAIVAYALAQAAMAGARSSDAGVDYAVLNTAARQMLGALTAPDHCVTHQLCQVTRSAGHVAPQARTPIKLASVALAWYAARLRQGPSSDTPGPYSEYCWSLVNGLRDSCPATQRSCRTA